MSLPLYLGYLVAALVIILTPGPDMLFCVATGIRGGRRAGIGATSGVVTGELVHITLSALGLAAIFRAAPPLYDSVRLLGAAYLVVLGISVMRRRDDPRSSSDLAASDHRWYVRGLATNLLNPKMALFAIAFLPQFVDAHAGGVALQFAVLGATFVVLDFFVLATVSGLAARFAAVLRAPRLRRRLDVVTGGVYIGLGARVALSR